MFLDRSRTANFSKVLLISELKKDNVLHLLGKQQMENILN